MIALLAFLCTFIMVSGLLKFPDDTNIPSSCKEIANTYMHYPDGEYWLRVTQQIQNTESVKEVVVKIYCHNMTTKPEEFLTLHRDNFSVDDSPAVECNTMFSKLKLSFPLTVSGSDKFSVSTGGVRRCPYGEAGDCLYSGRPACETSDCRGHFKIDLSLTGLTTQPTLDWATLGYAAATPYIIKSVNNQVISGRCGGHCGGCHPDTTNQIIHLLNTETTVPLHHGEAIAWINWTVTANTSFHEALGDGHYKQLDITSDIITYDPPLNLLSSARREIDCLQACTTQGAGLCKYVLYDPSTRECLI